MKLYVIRHGESENNAKGAYTGWHQINLTSKGIEQAKALRPMLSGIKFDRVYSSDLIRAKKTAENALPGCEYEETQLLREINVGSLAGVPIADFTPEDRARMKESGFSSFGGEGYDDFYLRVRSFIETVEMLDCENVAAFAHAGFLRAMFDEVVGCRLDGKKLLCSNCAVAIFEFKDGNRMLHSWINL